MAYKVDYVSSAKKDLKKLSIDIVLNILDSIDNYLAFNPSKDSEMQGKKYKGYFKYRVGDYRVVYNLDHIEKFIIVKVVAHRKEVYKILTRRI